MKDEHISGALQENLLCLLCWDDVRASQVRATLGSARLFESQIYRDVAERAIAFLDKFGVAIKEHISDELEDVLTGTDTRKATVYKKLLEDLYLSQEHLNGEYILSQLRKFVRAQTLKSALIESVEALEAGDVDTAETTIQRGLSVQVNTFEAGTFLSVPEQALGFLDDTEPALSMGIPYFEEIDLGPRRKELMLWMAAPGRGKSWALVHTGKWALLQGKTVLHVTLEMSEQRTSQRYVQSLFAVSKRHPEVSVPRLQLVDDKLTGIDHEELKRWTLQDPGASVRLTQKIKRLLGNKPPLIVKQFPTGALTMSMLRAYLDGLERLHKIIPDYLIIDYPDLMAMDSKTLREDIGETMKHLRGLGVERNMGVIGATQTNREGSRARIVDESNVAEDWSKIMIADSIISFNQTEEEKKLGLARLFAVKSRNDESRGACLITQSYAIGQFVMDSVRLDVDYWEFLRDNTPNTSAARVPRG